MSDRRIKVGIDVGGTFTHAVAMDADAMELVGAAVVPTTHGSEEGVAAGVVASMEKLLREAAISPADVVLIAHSTTQATNALLEGDVAKVGVLAMATGPAAFRARSEANVGRVELGDGAGLETGFRFLDLKGGLDEDRARSLLEELRTEGCEAVVVAEPFSVDDPAREERLAELAREMGLPATATSELSQLYGLRMRTLTAVVNASMLPRMIDTAERTATAVAKSGIAAPLMVMRSDGGIMDLESMRKRPILTMLSGPAAGVAAALMAERITDGVFVEVGGTSSDICLIRGGRPQIRHAEIAGRRLFVRTLDVRTVGVAGGSLPRVRRGRLHDVGPRSAHIAGLRYEAFEPSLRALHPELFRPRAADPADYLALAEQPGGAPTHALTPTGAANLLGLATGYSLGDSRSVAQAFKAAADHLDSTPEQVAEQIQELGSRKVATVVQRLLKEQRLAAKDLVMVGGGGGAEAVVPFTAGKLSMEHRIARHAEVISAIGVALGILQDSVERNLLNPHEGELVAMREEAFQRVQRMGADPDSIEVFVEVDQREKRVRATARGTPQMRTRQLGGDLPDTDALRAIAADSLRIASEATSWVGSPNAADHWMKVWTGERRTRILLGLLPAIRTPVCVLDGEGVVRYRAGDAHTEAMAARDVDGILARLLERFSTWGDGGLEVPEVHLVKPTQWVDLSGLVEVEQIQGLARAELASVAPDTQIVLIVRRRG